MKMFDPEIFDPEIFYTGDNAEPGAGELTPLPGIEMHELITLVKLDDYDEAEDRALTFTMAEHYDGESWPDVSTATAITLRLHIGGVTVSVTGTAVSAAVVSFNLTAAHTAAAGTGRFDVRATIGGNVVTLRQGKVTIYGAP